MGDGNLFEKKKKLYFCICYIYTCLLLKGNPKWVSACSRSNVTQRHALIMLFILTCMFSETKQMQKDR